MAKAKKDSINAICEDALSDPILAMPLTTFREYQAYNEEARKANKKFRYCRYEIKPCPEELHPKQRVIFHRNDQPNNPQPVYLRNHLIDYKNTLIPGKTYDLPHCVIDHLENRGTSKWKWFDNPDGSRETRVYKMEPRFSLRTKFKD